MTANPIGINQVIERLKQELRETAGSTDPLFVLGEVEVEISFTVERDASGGINFQVIQGNVEQHWTNVQTVRLKLAPLAPVEYARRRAIPQSMDEAVRLSLRGSDEGS